MNIRVRFSAGLVPLAGNTRMVVSLQDQATVADLLQYLQTERPELEVGLNNAIPMVAGRHVGLSEQLSAGQEVSLLLPVAGGSK
jgi:molybdopterin converting factor small subunit